MDFLYPFVEGFGSSHDCLDSASSLNATRSDWVLVYAASKVSVLRRKDLRKEWTFSSPPIRRYDQAPPTTATVCSNQPIRSRHWLFLHCSN